MSCWAALSPHPTEMDEALSPPGEGRDRLIRSKRFMRKDGRVIWCAIRSSTVRMPANSSIACGRQDVTERKESEERQKAPIDELNHRVRNALATVQSLANQTARGADRRRHSARLRGPPDRAQPAHDQLTRQIEERRSARHRHRCDRALSRAGPSRSPPWARRDSNAVRRHWRWHSTSSPPTRQVRRASSSPAGRIEVHSASCAASISRRGLDRVAQAAARRWLCRRGGAPVRASSWAAWRPSCRSSATAFRSHRPALHDGNSTRGGVPRKFPNRRVD